MAKSPKSAPVKNKAPAAPASPFAALAPLRDSLRDAAGQQKQAEERERRTAAKTPAPVPQPAPSAVPMPDLTDDEWMALAFSGAKAVAGPQRVAPAAPQEALAVAAQAVVARRAVPVTTAAAVAEPDLPDWWQPGVDPQFLWALGGERPWQTRAVLSGPLEQALGQLQKACKEAMVQHHACVLVDFAGITRVAPTSGDGNRMSTGAVVRQQLQSGALAAILGYMTAKPHDGGTTALYVWLRPKLQQR